MEYVLGIVTALVGILALLLRSETLKRAETETELIVAKQSEKQQKELNEGLVDRHVVKDKYIKELEEKVVTSLTGDELADALTSLFPESEGNDGSGGVSN